MDHSPLHFPSAFRDLTGQILGFKKDGGSTRTDGWETMGVLSQIYNPNRWFKTKKIEGQSWFSYHRSNENQWRNSKKNFLSQLQDILLKDSIFFRFMI